MKNTNEMKEFVNRNSLVEAQPKSSRRTTLHSRLSTFNFSLLTALSLVLCLLVGGKAWGASLTVYGDNTTTNQYVPIYGYWSDNKSKCEFIIPAEKLSAMNGGIISAMKFYLSSSSNNYQISATFQVFVKEVSATTLSAYTGTSGANIVYNNTITINTNASNVEFNIPFSSNYNYNGGNLLVGVYQTGSTSYNYTYWVGESQSSNTAWYGYGTGTGSATQFLPKTTFTYDPPYKAEWISAEVGSTSSWCIGETRTITLQVKNTGTATWYNSAANGGDNSGNQTDHDMVAVSYKWDEDEWYDSHPNTRNHFDRNIAPGETATITFDVEGPRKSGANHLRFNLIRQECCWFSYQNGCSNAPEKVVDVTVPDFTLAASNTVICNGGESVLSTNCDLPANIYTAQPYIWDWNSGAYNSGGGISDVSVSGSIIRFQTTNGDPQIPMYDIGSFDPNIYKTFRMRYRINSGTAGGMQVYHTWAGRTSATGEDQAHYGTLISDGNWHILEMDMVATAHTASNWTNCGAVLGWRLDVCSNSGVKMEIDWIGLFPDPIASNVSTYTATPSQTTTYYACNYMGNRPYIHLASANVAVVSEVSISLSSSPAALECITSGTSVTLTANAGGVIFSDGFEDGLGNWTVTSGNSNYQWSKKAGTGGSTYTTAHNGSFNAGAYYNSETNTYTYLRLNTDLSSYSDVKLSYWYMNPEWGSDVDDFYVQYSTDGTNYSNLSSTSSSHTTWTEVSNVPIPAGTKYIRFAAYNNYGYGAAVDDVKISISTAPTWAATGTAGTASGSTYTVTPKALSNTYTASASFSGCAEQQQSVSITTKPTITATSSVGNSDACDGSDVLLTATSNATDFVWSNNAGTDPVVTVHPTASTTYYVTASSATCTNTASVSVNVKTSPTITTSPDIASTCFDGSTQVTLAAGGIAPVVHNGSFSDDFESGLEDNWIVTADANNSNYVWGKKAGTGYTTSSPYNSAHGGSYSAGAYINQNDKWYYTTMQLDMDLSSYTNISLTFWYINGKWSSDQDVLRVQYSTNGSSWTDKQVYSSSITSWTSTTVTGFPENTKYIRFQGEGHYGYGIGIDDLSLTYNYTEYPIYSWSSTGTSGSASDATYTVTPSEGTNTYTVSANGCSRSITIDVLTANNITASGLTTDCGVPVTLSASGIEGATYDWYDGNTLVQANSPSFTPTNITEGKTYNVKVSKEIYGDVYEDVRTFTYTGTVQSVTIPEGTISAKLEVWGAQGGSYNSTYTGGKGGYAVGTLNNPSGTLYVVVGGQGSSGAGTTTGGAGGYNGGGKGGNSTSSSYASAGSGGGGATHIATATGLLSNLSSNTSSVLLVAGGGGGASGAAMCGTASLNVSNTVYSGGAAGNNGGKNTSCSNYSGNGGSAGTISSGGNGGSISTTTSSNGDRTYYTGGGGGAGAGYYGGGGGAGGSVSANGTYYGGTTGGNGSFGTGGNGGNSSSSAYGYYGGGGGSGAGGASYVSSSLQEAATYNGNVTFASTSGSTETGHEGSGYARITFYIQNHITCTSQPKQVALTVTPLTTPSAQDQTICPDNTASFSVDPAISGYTYHWQSGSDTGTGNSFTTASLDNTTTYHITATKAFDRIVAAYDFDYSGEMQEVEAPSGADYAILEVWGAEGGASQTDGHLNHIGGKGGYAKGKMEVSSGQHFYVVVGGKGHNGVIGSNTSVVTAIGGYNGGGSGSCDGSASENGNEEGSGGGGGATHIAKAAPSSGTDYQLYYYSSNQDDVLLVAGGGGGASWQSTGGYGGGNSGGRGVAPNGTASGGYAGGQTAKNSSGVYDAGIFGRGASGSGSGDGNGVAGGGGGWYGGGASRSTNSAGYNSGGGGSGHINTTQFTDYTILAGNQATIPNIAGTGTETGHSGNGHARIVFYKNGGGECVSSVANVDAIVNTPSVGTLTFTTDQNICPGTAVTLQVTSVNPTASEGLSYVWKKGSTTISGATTNTLADITAEATYNVNVTATNILNGKTCTANQSQNIAVTYKKPSSDELTDMGAANGYYIWTGNSSDWSATNNWMKYSTSNGGTYTLTVAPTASISVAVGKYNTCVSGSPTLNVNAPATAKMFKVGTGVTVSGSSTLTVGGAVTNKGTINGSLAMSVSGALTNSGTVNSSLTLNGTNTLTNDGTLNAPAVFNGKTTLAGSGSTTFSSVTINSGKTLISSSHSITISGDCTNNGTFTAGAGYITMTGNLANNGTFTGAGGTISITGDLTNARTFKTVAGALSLNGNLTNSGTFTIGGAGAVTLTGNWTNNGTFTPTGAGAVIFAGTSSQVIGGSNATTFKNVQFNNSANSLSISNEPTITGTATFSSGVVSGNVTLGSAATVSGAGTTSYVNGKVTKVMNANATFKFPIGTASLYAPFEAKSSAATNVSVQYASGSEDMPDVWNHSGNFSNVGLDHASDRENWQVSASATTNLSAIKLYWNTDAGNYHSFEEGADALESYLRIAAVKKNDFYWQNLGQSAIEGDFDGAGSITAANPLAITVGAKAAGDNDYFVTFASTNKGNLLLPIELISFTATCDGRSSLIEWTTATEKSNDYFSLERSDDAINFTEITRVAGAGNSIEPIDYSYTDYGIHGGDNYYRLVQVDYDGTRTVSEIVVANCIESEVDEPEVQAYPNPFNGELTLVLDNFGNRAATIEVYDMLGKLIYIQKADAPQNSYETILNLSNLPSGAYTVRVSTTDFVINKNVVKN